MKNNKNWKDIFWLVEALAIMSMITVSSVNFFAGDVGGVFGNIAVQVVLGMIVAMVVIFIALLTADKNDNLIAIIFLGILVHSIEWINSRIMDSWNVQKIWWIISGIWAIFVMAVVCYSSQIFTSNKAMDICVGISLAWFIGGLVQTLSGDEKNGYLSFSDFSILCSLAGMMFLIGLGQIIYPNIGMEVVPGVIFVIALVFQAIKISLNKENHPKKKSRYDTAGRID